MPLDDARDKVERWRMDYNEFRLHSALTHMRPAKLTKSVNN